MSQQINLFQGISREEGAKFSSQTVLRASVIVAAFIALLYMYIYWQVDVLRDEITHSEQRHAKLISQLDEAKKRFKVRTKSEALEVKVARLDKLVESRAHVKQILLQGAYRNTTGYSKYLLAVARQHIPGIWITGIEVAGAGDDVTLLGKSLKPELVPQFVQRLSNEPALAGVQFKVFRLDRPENEKTKQRAPYVDFLIKTSEVVETEES